MMKSDVREFEVDCKKRNIGFVAYCLPSWTEVFDSSWDKAVAPVKGVHYERFKDVRLCEEFFREAKVYIASTLPVLPPPLLQ